MCGEATSMRTIVVSVPVQDVERHRQYSTLANSLDGVGVLMIIGEAVIKAEIGHGFQFPAFVAEPPPFSRV